MVFEIGLSVMMNVPLAYLPPITLLHLPSIIGSLNSTFVILQPGLVLLFMTLLRIIMEIILEYPMTVSRDVVWVNHNLLNRVVAYHADDGNFDRNATLYYNYFETFRDTARHGGEWVIHLLPQLCVLAARSFGRLTR